MKHSASIFFVLLFALNSYAQNDSDRAKWAAERIAESKASTGAPKVRVTKFNFEPLWTRLDDNDSLLGYIGENYQRMRVVILSAVREPNQPDTYKVVGKSMVKNVVRSFSGAMKITSASAVPSSELEEDYKSDEIKEAGVVIGEYHFSEDAKQTNTGRFDGIFVTNWYTDQKGALQYDEVMAGADGYSNNQFAGTWTSYRTKVSKPASWGDSRIPVSGYLDIGAGEFSPEEKFISAGWQSYHNAYTKQDKKALLEENRQWWK